MRMILFNTVELKKIILCMNLKIVLFYYCYRCVNLKIVDTMCVNENKRISI